MSPLSDPLAAAGGLGTLLGPMVVLYNIPSFSVLSGCVSCCLCVVCVIEKIQPTRGLLDDRRCKSYYCTYDTYRTVTQVL